MSKPMDLKVSLQRARWRALPVIALILAAGVFVNAQAENTRKVKDVVIVHGAFADGSGWQSVYKILTMKGYSVTVVQNSTISLDDDVAATRRAIDAHDGPVILVGHSYGGAVISQAGSHPKVVGLVYIAAFALDNGESVGSWIKDWPPGVPAPPVLPPQDGFLLLDREKFPAAFAADVKPDVAEFMASSQVPWGVAALNGVVTDAAWKTKPSWYLLTTEDHMIPPETERFMAKRAGSKVVEVKASHAVFLSHPDAVASLIEQAASGATDPK
jgi:pimeloyl-ACP methyl ester carboxylesterase